MVGVDTENCESTHDGHPCHGEPPLVRLKLFALPAARRPNPLHGPTRARCDVLVVCCVLCVVVCVVVVVGVEWLYYSKRTIIDGGADFSELLFVDFLR